MLVQERFLKYVAFDTASHEGVDKTPSSDGQMVFAKALADEMRDIGIENVYVTDNAYLYGTIPANAKGDAIGLIAHLDTVDGVPCQPMKAGIVDYESGDITLENGDVVSEKVYPNLKSYRGQKLIVTDGRTILGADDKAGIAEILTLAERLISDDTIPHGKIGIAFTPDEEIGSGAELLDIPGFGVDYAYTVDGGELGEIEYENFNAASATIRVHGVNIHPGSAKDKMKNAALMASEFANMMPSYETPAHTEGREGFYHLTSISGDEENACLHYIIRDHDLQKLEDKKTRIKALTDYMNVLYGAGTFEIELIDSYRNMIEVLKDHMEIVERAKDAMKRVDVDPVILPIRGGTDGARLSYRGLLCPNLSTGGFNGHGRHEMIPVKSMEKMVDMLTELVRTDR